MRDDVAGPDGSELSEGLGQPRELLGTMYVARKPCGRVSAACWYDPKDAADTAKSVARWIKRGDTVEMLKRYKGDPQPDWCCASGQPCACRDAGLLA